MSKYYTVPALHDYKVFYSFHDAVEFIKECSPEDYESMNLEDKAELIQDLIEETNYFEDLNKEQQDYLMDK